MTEPITELHNALHLAASDVLPNVPPHVYPAMMNTMYEYLC